MKSTYLGGARGHQAAVYRPGSGWSGGEEGRRFGRQPRAFKNDGSPHICPLTMAQRRRPGLRTKSVVIVAVIAVAALLSMVVNGGTLF